MVTVTLADKGGQPTVCTSINGNSYENYIRFVYSDNIYNSNSKAIDRDSYEFQIDTSFNNDSASLKNVLFRGKNKPNPTYYLTWGNCIYSIAGANKVSLFVPNEKIAFLFTIADGYTLDLFSFSVRKKDAFEHIGTYNLKELDPHNLYFKSDEQKSPDIFTCPIVSISNEYYITTIPTCSNYSRDLCGGILRFNQKTAQAWLPKPNKYVFQFTTKPSPQGNYISYVEYIVTKEAIFDVKNFKEYKIKSLVKRLEANSDDFHFYYKIFSEKGKNLLWISSWSPMRLNDGVQEDMSVNILKKGLLYDLDKSELVIKDGKLWHDFYVYDYGLPNIYQNGDGSYTIITYDTSRLNKVLLKTFATSHKPEIISHTTNNGLRRLIFIDSCAFSNPSDDDISRADSMLVLDNFILIHQEHYVKFSKMVHYSPTPLVGSNIENIYANTLFKPSENYREYQEPIIYAYQKPISFIVETPLGEFGKYVLVCFDSFASTSYTNINHSLSFSNYECVKYNISKGSQSLIDDDIKVMKVIIAVNDFENEERFVSINSLHANSYFNLDGANDLELGGCISKKNDFIKKFNYKNMLAPVVDNIIKF